jgi:hypothetical protein
MNFWMRRNSISDFRIFVPPSSIQIHLTSKDVMNFGFDLQKIGVLFSF